jgi:hypothetical protein
MKRLTSLTLLGLILLTSCKKDKTPFPLEPPYNDLEHGWMDEPTESDFVDPQTVTPYFTNYKYQYRVPQFNPNNPDEIIYFYENNEENLQQLVKYNLKTTQKTVLINNMRIIGEPAWSRQGWIAFAHFPSYQMYLVKDDGTGLMQFTEDVTNLYPQWSADGNYLYWGYAAVLAQNTKWLRKNHQDNIVDTISFGSIYPNSVSPRSARISSSNVVLSTKFLNNSVYFVYAELNTLPLNFVPVLNTNELPNYSRSQCWANNSDYFYVSFYSIGEIYQVRVSDGSYELFRPQYYANWIQTIDASPDGKYLVAERVDKFNLFEPDGSIAPPTGLRHRIQLIDLETKQIKILDLD